MTIRRVLPIVFGVALLCSSFADAQTKRRVFVLHSGMHVILAPKDKDHAARTMKQLFAKRGISERDLVALESPFPTATWDEMIPRAGLLIYLDSADPKSRASQDAYLRLDRALKAQGVTKTDDLIWIGHSAGGQMGMTMAHIAHNLAKFPELAKKTQSYHFDTVITLGSAVGSNPTPADVKLRHYCSSGDTMVYFLATHGDLVAGAVKSKVRFRLCCDVGANCKLRVFPGIEHPNWYGDDAVLNCILREGDTRYCPAWRRAQADASQGSALGQSMARLVDSELRISLEEDK